MINDFTVSIENLRPIKAHIVNEKESTRNQMQNTEIQAFIW